jgi:hypothetical protein
VAGRKQWVVLEGASSGWEEVISGVPQGNVLGLVLFLIFITDLDRAATGESKLKKFADDTKVAKQIQGEEDRAELQRTLVSMMEWARTWGMEFHRQEVQSHALWSK